MSAISYLFLSKCKNSLKEMLKKPAKLIAYILLLAMFVLVIVSGNMGDAEQMGPYRDTGELGAMILALFAVIFVSNSMKGLGSGASFYTMPDANLLFPAPVRTMRVLLYGLIRQAGMSLMVGAFLFFQYAWLHNLYGVTIGTMFLIFLGYSLTFFLSQLTAMAIYSFTAGSERKKVLLKRIVYAVCILAVVLVLLPALQDKQNMLTAVVQSANSPLISFFPVAGWTKSLVYGAMTAQPLPVWLGALGCAAFAAALILLIAKSNADFYEDVLQATEVGFRLINERKSGRMAEITPEKVKVGKSGIHQGWGPSVFYYKQMLENRRAKTFLIDTMSLIFIGCTILFAVIMNASVDRAFNIFPIFFFATYMQLFASATGRWLKELTKHYVYLVPAGAFKKLVMICRENIAKICMEAVLLFVILGVLMQASPVSILACIAARIGFGILFMAGNVLSERLLGSIASKGLLLSLYFLILLLIAAPGIAGAIVVYVLAQGTYATALALLATLGWNLLASLIIFAACRDILNYAELNDGAK